MADWTANSWKSKTVHQDVVYEDQQHLDRVLSKLNNLPPLVSPNEIEKLRDQLKEVAEGKRFLLQGGDCAELFDYCSQDPIENKLKLLLQMSLILVWGGRTSVVRIARMGGQYAKPRSKPTEIIDGKEYIAFRGDNVNGIDKNDRNPNPERLLQSYFHAAATINYVRTLLSNGFADLHKAEAWDIAEWKFDHVKSPTVRLEYQNIVERLRDSLDFMHTIGADSTPLNSMNTVDLFMSHEGLLLDYESQLTRNVGEDWYNLGSHFLWIGDRTRQLDGAHVEYFRGIKNPIGIKVGPSMKPEELIALLNIVNPNCESGKVTLITRYGHDKVGDYLPNHIKAVQESSHRVVWCCDPMHGNTELSTTGIKTRKFENIVMELSKAFRIHKENGSSLGGVHLELTGDRVTEAIGGSMQLLEEDLSLNYQTYCDPRLNYEQSLDISFMIAKYFSTERSFSSF